MGAILPIDPRQPRFVVHPDEKDLPAHEQTRWPIFPQSGLIKREIEDASFIYTPQGRLSAGRGTNEYLLIKLALGQPESGPFAPFWAEEKHPRLKRPVPTDGFLERLPGKLWSWLLDRANESSSVTGDEAGKSKPPSTSPSAPAASPAPTADDAASPATSS